MIFDSIFQQLSYVACQMRFGADRTHKPCVESFGASWEEILQCVESDFSTNQQLEYERSTTPVLAQTSWVPTVVYNGKITEFSHTDNAPPLKDVLCNLIHNTNSACKTLQEF